MSRHWKRSQLSFVYPAIYSCEDSRGCYCYRYVHRYRDTARDYWHLERDISTTAHIMTGIDTRIIIWIVIDKLVMTWIEKHIITCINEHMITLIGPRIIIWIDKLVMTWIDKRIINRMAKMDSCIITRSLDKHTI